MTKETDISCSISDPAMREALGAVIANFGDLELVLGAVVRVLVHPGEIEKRDRDALRIITSRLTFSQLVRIARALYRHRFPEDNPEEALRLFDQLDRLRKERNKVIHTHWIKEEAGAVRRFSFTEDSKTGIRYDSPRVTREDLANLANRVRRERLHLRDWFNGLRERLRSGSAREA